MSWLSLVMGVDDYASAFFYRLAVLSISIVSAKQIKRSMVLFLLILMLLGVLAALGFLLFVVHVVRLIGMAVLCVIFVGFIAVGYIGVFISGVSTAGFFQWWGRDNGGWALFAGGCIGLLTSVGLIVAVVDEVKARIRLVVNVFRSKVPRNKGSHHSHD